MRDYFFNDASCKRRMGYICKKKVLDNQSPRSMTTPTTSRLPSLQNRLICLGRMASEKAPLSLKPEGEGIAGSYMVMLFTNDDDGSIIQAILANVQISVIETSVIGDVTMLNIKCDDVGELEKLRLDRNVASIEEDGLVTMDYTCTQQPTVTWGIDRVDQELGTDGEYDYYCYQGDVVCEGRSVTIECINGTIIEIKSAMYGRTVSGVCSGPNAQNTNCHNDVTSTVAGMCNGLDKCTVPANNGVFGDPCVGTFKYLDIDSICLENQQTEYSEMVCEGDYVTVQCTSGTTILVQSAMYGRTVSNVCPGPNQQNTNCYNDKTAAVAGMCNGLEKCMVPASNNVFGDPCVGTFKYLDVDFICVKTDPFVENGMRCEGNTLTLKCTGYATILVQSAMYGRTASDVCSGPNQQNTNCYNNATDTVAGMCDGLSYCQVSVDNAVFGDPCVGTYKYLDVVYRCECPVSEDSIKLYYQRDFKGHATTLSMCDEYVLRVMIVPSSIEVLGNSRWRIELWSAPYNVERYRIQDFEPGRYNLEALEFADVSSSSRFSFIYRFTHPDAQAMLALGKPAYQSSTYLNATATSFTRSVLPSRTNLDVKPWFVVDLLQTYTVEKVKIITETYNSYANNVAFGKSTLQSSTAYGNASKAVDGNFDSRYCTATEWSTDPWWVVDLGSPNYVVHAMLISRPYDVSYEWMDEFYVGVGNTDPNLDPANFDPTQYTLCASSPFAGSSSYIGQRVLYCNTPLTGRYVAIYLIGQHEQLSLCEVQVFNTDVRLIQSVFVGVGDSFSASTFDPSDYTLCQTTPTILEGNPTYTQTSQWIVCDKPIEGRYVTIYRTTTDHLMLYWVNVNGKLNNVPDVYVIDSGVIPLDDFAGRVFPGWSAFGSPADSLVDHLGHGTHVAGTVGSNTYGVSKNVNIHSVKVFDINGSTYVTTIVNAMQFVREQAAYRSRRTVVNMSLGGPRSDALDAATDALIDTGAAVAVSAGNNGIDACFQSPARAPNAVTVACSNMADGVCSFSNHGSCVDVFAPGRYIESWDHTGARNTKSGTSMSSPHVAGAIAMWLEENYAVLDTKTVIKNKLDNEMTLNAIKMPAGILPTVNKLLRSHKD